MKKIISLVLALVMILGMTTVVSAEIWETNPEAGENAWPAGDTVTETDVVKIIMDTADPIPVYKVDIRWDSLEFKYTAGDAAVASWNPDEHLYVPAGTATWNKTSADITVINHSSVAVSINASIDNATKNGVTANIGNGVFDLASAVGTTVADAPKNTITVDITGTPETNVSEFDIGTVTVTVTPKP